GPAQNPIESPELQFASIRIPENAAADIALANDTSGTVSLRDRMDHSAIQDSSRLLASGHTFHEPVGRGNRSGDHAKTQWIHHPERLVPDDFAHEWRKVPSGNPL